jgi:hypothetical protein
MKPSLKLVSDLSPDEQKFVNMVTLHKRVAALDRTTGLNFTSSFTGQINYEQKTFNLSLPSGYTTAQLIPKIKLDSTLMGAVVTPGQVWGINFRVLKFADNHLVCAFPDSFYEINRRKVKRWPIPEGFGRRVHLELQNKTVSPLPVIFHLSDLSPLGLSFKIPAMYERFFQVGQVIPNCFLHIGGKTITLHMEIRNILATNDPHAPKKAGTQFIKLNPVYQLEIVNYLQTYVKT